MTNPKSCTTVTVSMEDNNNKEEEGEEGPPPDEDEQETLKWRGDPKETFSDWKIEIVHHSSNNDNGNDSDGGMIVDTYNVHKFVLAYGARRSEYFTKLFQSELNFLEAQQNTSRIELEPLAAVAFPALLDYLYNSTDQPLTINTQTATALHSLGEYFDMRRLRWDAKQFCNRDLSLQTIMIYYEQARNLHNETVFNLLARFMGLHILEIEPTSAIVRESDPQLWLEVLKWAKIGHLENAAVHQEESEEEDDRDIVLSLHFSDIVANLNLGSLDAKSFQQLTDERTLPQVSPNAALTLCEMDDIFSTPVESSKVEEGTEETEEETCDSSSEATTNKDDVVLDFETSLPSLPIPTIVSSLPSLPTRKEVSSTLQQRCATALSKNWQKLVPAKNRDGRQDSETALPCLPPNPKEASPSPQQSAKHDPWTTTLQEFCGSEGPEDTVDSSTAATNKDDVVQDSEIGLPSPPTPEEVSSSSLQQRCATALSKNWRKLSRPDELTREALMDRKSTFLVELLVQSLWRSRVALEDSRHQLKMAQEELKEFERNKAMVMSLQKRSKDVTKYIGDLRYQRDQANKKLSKFQPVELGAELTSHTVPFPEDLNNLNKDGISSIISPVACNCHFDGVTKERAVFVYTG